MNNLIPKIKERIQTKTGITLLIVGVLSLIILLYFKLFGYFMVIAVVIGFFYLAQQGDKENKTIISPREKEMREKELEEKEMKIQIVKTHIAENPIDLDAKLKLKEMEQELNELKEKYKLS